ncbi:hypothetical protein ACIPVK_03270 [Paeniglutamicibacter sp. MACA_103]|uniref:hypothetical protein n=1 Tax=Paeniglutamicibacter sp. MACA_103 TaxID=3377337 RepID=UPI0038933148
MKKSMALFAMSGFAAAALFAATPASADWSVDTSTGTGFVGKGDVHDAFGWNDHDLQANHTGVSFALNAESTSTTTWSCFNANNGKTQDRKHVVQASTTGELLHEARTNPQDKVTGFLLTGLADGASVVSETEGPKPDSCPSGPWTFVAGSSITTVTGRESGLSVRFADQVQVLTHAGAE